MSRPHLPEYQPHRVILHRNPRGCLLWPSSGLDRCRRSSRSAASPHGLPRQTRREINSKIASPSNCQCKGHTVRDFLQACGKVVQLETSGRKDREGLRIRIPVTSSKCPGPSQNRSNQRSPFRFVRSPLHHCGVHNNPAGGPLFPALRNRHNPQFQLPVQPNQ